MTVNIPFDFNKFGTHIFKALGHAVICVVSIFLTIYLGEEGNSVFAIIFGVIAFYFGIKAYLWPIIVALDVKDRAQAIEYQGKTYNINYSKGQKVQHPYFVLILLINIFLGGTFFGWIVALVWACAPGDIEVPFTPPIDEPKSEEVEEPKSEEVVAHTKNTPKVTKPKTINCHGCGAPVNTGDKCDFCGRLA